METIEAAPREAEREVRPGAHPEVSSEDRLWAVGCHLAAFLGYAIPFPGVNVLGPLVVWMCRRDESAYVDEQGRRALNFQITIAILFLFSLLWVLVLVGFLLLWAIPIINAIFVIVAAIEASRGKDHRYPFTMSLVKPRRGAVG